MHFYQDISHFRAPYKNYQTIAGFGAVDPSVPAPTDPTAAITVKGEDGILRYNAATIEFIRSRLMYYAALPVSDTVVRAEQFNEQTLAQAAADPKIMEGLLKSSVEMWVREKIAAGFAVYVPFSFLYPTTESTAGVGIQIAAVPATDYAAAVEYSKVPVGAFLADPKDGWKTAAPPNGKGTTPVVPAGLADPKHALIALAIVGGAGIAAWGINKVMKRRGYRPVLSGSLAR
jgi:hypothetical protein